MLQCVSMRHVQGFFEMSVLVCCNVCEYVVSIMYSSDIPHPHLHTHPDLSSMSAPAATTKPSRNAPGCTAVIAAQPSAAGEKDEAAATGGKEETQGEEGIGNKQGADDDLKGFVGGKRRKVGAKLTAVQRMAATKSLDDRARDEWAQTSDLSLSTLLFPPGFVGRKETQGTVIGKIRFSKQGVKILRVSDTISSINTVKHSEGKGGKVSLWKEKSPAEPKARRPPKISLPQKDDQTTRKIPSAKSPISTQSDQTSAGAAPAKTKTETDQDQERDKEGEADKKGERDKEGEGDKEGERDKEGHTHDDDCTMDVAAALLLLAAGRNSPSALGENVTAPNVTTILASQAMAGPRPGQTQEEESAEQKEKELQDRSMMEEDLEYTHVFGSSSPHGSGNLESSIGKQKTLGVYL